MRKKDFSSTNDQIDIAIMSNDIKYLVQSVQEIKNKLERDYISREEFKPIQRVVYGFTGLVLLGVVGALLALVIRK